MVRLSDVGTGSNLTFWLFDVLVIYQSWCICNYILHVNIPVGKIQYAPPNSLVSAFNSGMYAFRTSSMHFPTCMSIYTYISAFSFVVKSHSM